jgi:hypothetical protein
MELNGSYAQMFRLQAAAYGLGDARDPDRRPA